VNVDEMNSAIDSAAVSRQLDDASRAAQDAGVSSTPSFLVGPTGGKLAPVDQDGLADAIEQQLAAASK
jgi:protein-disulfide isomerase